MKKFFSLLSLFFLAFITATLLLILTSNKLVEKGNHFSIKKKSSYLVMGNSHAKCAFNDSLISGFVNCAEGGEPYLFTYIKTKKLIKENKQIKTVFIELSNNQIAKPTDKWIWGDSSLTNFYPLYAPFLNLQDLRMLLEKNLKCVFYVQPVSLKKNISYILERKNFLENKRWGGYKNLKGIVMDSLFPNKVPEKTITEVSADTLISKVNLEYLTKTIKFLRQNNIDVFLIRSPVHPMDPSLNNEKKFREILAAKFKHINFLDFVSFPLYNKEYGDFQHLNYKGAKTFSVFFNTLIENGLLLKEQKQNFIDSSMMIVRKERL